MLESQADAFFLKGVGSTGDKKGMLWGLGENVQGVQQQSNYYYYY